MREPRALLLDLDNTLVDRDLGVARWLAALVPSTAVERLLVIDRGGQGVRAAFFAAVGDTVGRSAAEVSRAFARELPALMTLKPGVDRLLGAFRGPKIVVSNGSGRLQRAKLAMTGLASQIDHVLISGELGLQKPDAAIFHRALACAGVEAKDACMIGDDPVADIEGATAAGIAAIMVRTRWFDAPRGIAIVDRLDEVFA
jgi:putative hydrolase of the HAD superfamily